MRVSSKTFVGAFVGLSLLVPAISQASSLTTDQVNAIIQLLQSFNADASTVAHVQASLTGQNGGDNHGGMWQGSTTWSGATSTWAGNGSTTPWGMPPGQVGKMACITLSRNLGPGSQGDDVKKLQELLASDSSSGFTANPNGFFGPMTQRAMMHYQMEHGIASSSSATGAVGPMTRGFFERACGNGLGGGMGPGGGDNHPGWTGSTTPGTMGSSTPPGHPWLGY
jgi:hypothetical protein